MEIALFLICMIIFYKIIFKIIKVAGKISDVADDKLKMINNNMEIKMAKQRYKLACDMIERNTDSLSKKDIEKLKNYLNNL